MTSWKTFRAKLSRLNLDNLNLHRLGVDGLIVVISVMVITAIAYAGSLTPSASPASTMHSLLNMASKDDNNTFSRTTDSLEAISDTIATSTSATSTDTLFGWQKTLYDYAAPASTALASSTTWTYTRAGYLDAVGLSTYDSSAVSSDNDGSILERLEYLSSRVSANIDYNLQKYQDKDDWVNSGGTTGEYTGEEVTWTEVSGSPFAGYDTINYAGSGGDLDLDSGQIKRDERTGLWWSDCSSVAGTASTTDNVFTWTAAGSRPTGGNAIGFCNALNTANFGGYNDWYLPTQKELQQAYIDGAANNLLEPDHTFWSSTELYNSASRAWHVHLNYGYTNNLTKGNSYYVRCVRR